MSKGSLVRLEINNFKSYKDQHVIGPFKSLTAVIGPNGSGKSNLMDAISFVLGVQSTQLRSSNLKDLIYSSSSMRLEGEEQVPTLERATSAYVSAVYRDANGQETTFTRSISEDGHSEYTVNGRSMRRETYVSKLEKYNILVKARNFLVFQGDVEAIASQTPKHLTRWIEQVSGSLDLKTDYDRYKQEWEHAAESLSLVFQKKRGFQAELKQYTHQHEEAKQYEKVQSEKDAMEVQYKLWKLYHLEVQLQRAQDTLDTLVADQTEYEALEAGLHDDIQRGVQEHAKRTQNVLHSERALTKEQRTLATLRPTLAQHQKTSQQTREKVDQLQLQLARLDTDITRQRDVIRDLEIQVGAVQRAQTTLLKEVTSQDQTRQGLLKHQEEYQKTKTKFLMESLQWQQEKEALSRTKEATQEKMQDVRAQLTQLNAKWEGLESDRVEASEKRDRLRMALETTQHELGVMNQKLARVDTRLAHLREQEQSLHEKLASVSEILMEYKLNKHESEREKQFRETVSQLKALFPGVLGQLSDLCRPTQQKFELAVSIVLGRHVRSIVTDTQATAMECIAYLRDQRRGHATFLPLRDLETKSVPPVYRTFPHARPAVDVIRYEKELEPAILYACGKALITETLDVAKSICFDQHQRVKAVTLEGITIHKSGMMSGGGMASLSTSTPWETMDIEAAKQAHEKLLAEIQTLALEKRKDTNKAQLQAERDALEQQLAHLRQSDLNVDLQLASLKDQLEALSRKRTDLQVRLAEYEAVQEDPRLTTLEQQIQAIRQRLFRTFCRNAGVKSVEEYETLAVLSVAEETQQQTALARQHDTLMSTLSYEQDQLVQLQQRQQHTQQVLYIEKEKIQQSMDSAAALQVQVIELEKQVESLADALAQHRQHLQERSRRLSKRRRQLQEVLTGRESLDKKLAQQKDLTTQLHHQRISTLREASLDLVSIKLTAGSLKYITPELTLAESPAVSQRIQVDYSELPDDLKTDGSEEANAKFQETFHRLQQQLDQLAPSVRVFDKLTEANDQFTAVEREFEAARLSAKNAKDHFYRVKQQRCQRFMDAFKHIQERIDPIYKDLTMSRTFPLGGTAYLSLESEDTPFEEGIKFHAMPPMKRFRDMDQLSGGEKTVAALALLFSVHSYRPAPFFVLDEVDAALDNANIAKVARYIAKAANQVQFLVISLKNTLYEHVHSLVGVYRDVEKQSSGVLTLDLEQYEE